MFPRTETPANETQWDETRWHEFWGEHHWTHHETDAATGLEAERPDGSYHDLSDFSCES